MNPEQMLQPSHELFLYVLLIDFVEDQRQFFRAQSVLISTYQFSQLHFCIVQDFRLIISTVF